MKTPPLARATALFACAFAFAAPPALAQRPAPLPMPRPMATISASQIAQIRLRPQRQVATPVTFTVAAPVFKLANLPDVDLRPAINGFNINVRNQGSRNTCSVFALTFLLEYMYAKHFGTLSPNLSEEYLNAASNLAIGKQADGGFFDAIDLGYQNYGDVGEGVLPYRAFFTPNLFIPDAMLQKGMVLAPRLKPHFIKPWNVNTGLSGVQLLSITLQLKAGRPVAVGLRWPKNDEKFKTETILGVTMMTAPAPADVVDGHSIAFVGFKASNAFPGGGYFIFRNSWGNGFMDGGYGYMSFDYASKYANDAFEYVLP